MSDPPFSNEAMSDPSFSDEANPDSPVRYCDPRLPDDSIYGPDFDSYINGKTCVLWNVEDYPIPSGSDDPVSMGKKIKAKLVEAKYLGEVSIKAYVDTLSDELQQKFDDAGISVSLIPQGCAFSKSTPLIVDALGWALDNPAPANMIVLSNNMAEFGTIMHFECMYRVGYGIVLPDTSCGWLPPDTDWLPPLEKSTWFLEDLFVMKR